MTSLPSPDLFVGSASLLGEKSGAQPDLAACQALVSRFGHQSSAYFNLQSGVRRFGARGLGFLSYRPVKCLGRVFNFVFANPVCEPRMRRWLLRAFLNSVPGRHLFVGVDAEVAADLASLGFHLNEFGTEYSLPLAEFSLAGKAKKQLRHAANLHHRAPVSVLEQPWQDVDGAAVKALSEAWRQHKAVGSRELRLLTRPPVYGDEWGVRKFYAYDGDGRLLGFVFFDPFFEQGQVTGYTANILRQDLERAPTGLLDYIILTAMQVFQQEGVSRLSLGIAPLHGVEAMAGERRLVRHIAQLLYQHGNQFYAFKALSYHKTRFRGEETKWYLATDRSSCFSIAVSALLGTQVLTLPWARA
ncbi:MAG: DUF2156 domain-containing protein [Marinobacter sp.]|nr:DUF2156 domain-containing protein [Marinobacter sp.]